jgi:hypothetical protein
MDAISEEKKQTIPNVNYSDPTVEDCRGISAINRYQSVQV